MLGCWLGRFLARLHAVGEQEAFVHRPELNLQTLGWDSHRDLMACGLIDPAQLAAWDAAARRALDAVAQATQHSQPRHLRLHGDCHLGNLLWDANGPVFVDLDDCIAGPAVQDLWMLVSGGGGDIPHFQNFSDAIRENKPLNSPISEGQKGSLLCHLANIAYRTSSVLDIDQKTGHIVGNPAAQKLWKREYRPGWEPKV